LELDRGRKTQLGTKMNWGKGPALIQRYENNYNVREMKKMKR